MKKQFIAIVLYAFCVLLTSCSGNRDVAGATEAQVSSTENQSATATQLELPQDTHTEPSDSDPFVDIGISGFWQDNSGFGYSMEITSNEDGYSFLISYMYSGYFLEWTFSGKPSPQDGCIVYTDGTYSETNTRIIEGDDIQPETNQHTNESGTVTISDDRSSLLWEAPSQEIELTFVRREESQGNAWADILIYGESYEEAVANGWGDEWMSLANGMGTDGIEDYNMESSGSDGYADASDTQISESEIREINTREVLQLANKWKNNYNKGLPQQQRITTISPRTIYPEIQYSGPIAIVTTEIEYWFWGKGGSSSGSVYAIVNIDSSDGAIISSSISY